MPSSRTPPLLQPYTRLSSEGALVLLTTVLGASANWLVIRFLCDALSSEHNHNVQRFLSARDGDGWMEGDISAQEQIPSAVVLVSWMRDWEFWRTEARKIGGLDLQRLAQQKRFAFVDGLTKLFADSLNHEHSQHSLPVTPIQQSSPVRQSPLSIRNSSGVPPRTAGLPGRHPAGQGGALPGPSEEKACGLFQLTSPHLSHIQETIESAIDSLKEPFAGAPKEQRRLILILDSPDLLLAVCNPSSDYLTPTSLNASILQLRRHVHSLVLAVAADSPLMTPVSTPTPLEVNHAAFVVGMAHLASYVMSLRLLDTGFAADISGVLRVTLGDEEMWDTDADSGEGGCGKLEEKEVLYHVAGDGVVKVFERGAGS